MGQRVVLDGGYHRHHKALELLAYKATILRAERSHEVGMWMAYDRQFRRQALTRKSLIWSVTRLYNEGFTPC